jgi:hypothetical protein
MTLPATTTKVFHQEIKMKSYKCWAVVRRGRDGRDAIKCTDTKLEALLEVWRSLSDGDDAVALPAEVRGERVIIDNKYLIHNGKLSRLGSK